MCVCVFNGGAKENILTKMDLVPSEWREILNETLYNLYTRLNSFGIMFYEMCEADVRLYNCLVRKR